MGGEAYSGLQWAPEQLSAVHYFIYILDLVSNNQSYPLKNFTLKFVKSLYYFVMISEKQNPLKKNASLKYVKSGDSKTKSIPHKL